METDKPPGFEKAKAEFLQLRENLRKALPNKINHIPRGATYFAQVGDNPEKK